MSSGCHSKHGCSRPFLGAKTITGHFLARHSYRLLIQKHRGVRVSTFLNGIRSTTGKMAIKDSDLVKLQHADFWDSRYAQERAEAKEKDQQAELGSFEWFGSFEGLRPFFAQYMPKADAKPSVLHLGCGNSVSLPVPI